MFEEKNKWFKFELLKRKVKKVGENPQLGG